MYALYLTKRTYMSLQLNIITKWLQTKVQQILDILQVYDHTDERYKVSHIPNALHDFKWTTDQISQGKRDKDYFFFYLCPPIFI